MRTSLTSHPRPNWLPRAIIAGFVGSAVMLLTFIAAYVTARLLAVTGVAGQISGFLGDWLHNLVNNPVVQLATSYAYLALGLYFIGGLVWAVIYAAWVEPRLSGPPWRIGMLYALLLAVISLVVVLPLTGGGFAGATLGAGPLPALGIVLVHLIYGVTLGGVYGPSADIDAVTLRGAAPHAGRVQHAESTMAAGIVGGAALGAVAGWLISLFSPFAFFPIVLVLGGALLLSALGGLVASFAGLSPSDNDRTPRPRGGQHVS